MPVWVTSLAELWLSLPDAHRNKALLFSGKPMTYFKPRTVQQKEDYDIRREMRTVDWAAQSFGEQLHAERRRKHKQCYAEQQLKRYRKEKTLMVDPNLGLR